MVGTNFFTKKTSTLDIALTDENGLAILAKCTDTLPSTANLFQHGCILIKTDTGDGNKAIYENVGTSASPSWNLIGSITSGEISLAEGKMLIGNSSGVATAVTISGDIAIDTSGVATIQNGVVTASKLATALQPSHVAKYAGTVTWSGGGASLEVTVNGVLATDIVIATITNPPTEAAYLKSATPSANKITFTLSAANTSNDAQISYVVFRAIS